MTMPDAPVPAAERTVTADEHRAFMSSFPTGVAVVTSIGGDGRPHGLTCTSLTSVTLAPPTLLLCLGVRSGTLAALRECGGFAVNLLHSRGRRAAELFASRDPRRFALAPWRPTPGTGMPWLDRDAFAVAECEVGELAPVGDHVVVFGMVRALQWRPDVPLLYGLRAFSSWASPSAAAG
jgi:flavin reductase (DIM6/NTAB) family NADH-FMN oxidoreductase RutF